MSPRVEHIVLTAGAAVLLLLTGIDVGVAVSNGAIQREFTSNNQILQQSAQQQGLYQEMIRALQDMAISRNDDQLRELLAKHGVNLAPQPPPAPAATAKPKGAR